jgi:hypothetical protein
VTSALLLAVGAILLVAGPTMAHRGLTGRRQIQDELAKQKIIFAERSKLPADLARYAGSQVRTGEQAKAYAELIGVHVARATGGRTYSEIADEWLAGGRSDERLGELRETAFMGQSLRGSLLGAYQAWQITTLVTGLGIVLAAIGLVFLALAATLS